MPTPPPLTALGIDNITSPGVYSAGKVPGLALRVRESKNGGLLKQWIFRYMINRKPRLMGLGSYDDLTLEAARKLAKELRLKIKVTGIDILEEKFAKAQTAKELDLAKKLRRTFDQCAKEYIDTHRITWKNKKHAAQWENTLRDYASPHIGSMYVDEITRAHLVSMLSPIWVKKNETASRIRGRIEQIMDWATARELRKGDNPARWAGCLKGLLPDISRKQRIKHHPALSHSEIGGFVAMLKKSKEISAKALEFTILTASRTNEVIGARWKEFDLKNKVWIIPKERMKAKREHRVPLSTQVMAILKKSKEVNDDTPVFSNPKGIALSNMAMLSLLKRLGKSDITVHGFRSTFRVWAGESTTHPREVIEHALAHSLPDVTEAAYARTTLLAKRAALMQDWANRCYQKDDPKKGK